ncbi:MAG: hypothetical protein AB8G86_29700 [Saprospiraceae bacterium]
MRETKLMLLLKQFEIKELKAFDKFIHSPYFNTNETLTQLWLLLKKYAPNFDAPQLANQKVFKKLFPKTTYNEKRLRQLRSQLFKLVEAFLAIERFKQDRFSFKKGIGDAYLEKGMKDNFERKYDELQTSFGTEAFLSTSALHQKMSLYHQLYFNELNVKGDECSTDLINGTFLLEKCYVQQKLIYTLEWLSSNLRYNYDIPQNILNYVDLLKDRSIFNNKNSTQAILENAVKLLVAGDNWEDLFKKLNNQFSQSYAKIDTKSKNLMLRLLINYSIHKEDKGLNMQATILQLYKLGLTDEGIFYKGLMTNVTFMNIVTTALKQGESVWAKAFIKEEKYRLYEPQNEQFLYLAKATVLYYEQKRQDCLEILAKMERSDLTTLELIKRNFQIRVIFECYQTGQVHVKMLFANIEKYQKYLQRKQIFSDSKRKAYQNFGKYILRLANWCENNGNEKQLNKIKNELIQEESFPNKSKAWLLKHIYSFENEHGVALRTTVDSQQWQ